MNNVGIGNANLLVVPRSILFLSAEIKIENAAAVPADFSSGQPRRNEFFQSSLKFDGCTMSITTVSESNSVTLPKVSEPNYENESN